MLLAESTHFFHAKARSPQLRCPKGRCSKDWKRGAFMGRGSKPPSNQRWTAAQWRQPPTVSMLSAFSAHLSCHRKSSVHCGIVWYHLLFSCLIFVLPLSGGELGGPIHWPSRTAVTLLVQCWNCRRVGVDVESFLRTNSNEL